MNHHRPSGEGGGMASPPWEALYLVGHHLDAKTLATASCASKSWLNCLSSDHLWQPLFSAAFPYIDPHPASDVPYCRLYAAFHTASKRRRREPPKPAISLHSLLFMVSINSPMGPAKTVVKPCKSLEVDPNGLFRFDIDVDAAPWTIDALDGMRVAWHVVLEEWKGVFQMMECSSRKAGGKLGTGVDGWFSEELPSPGCCSRGGASGLVGELRLRVRFVDRGGGSKAVVEKVSVGVLNIYSWRYVRVDDALCYLQHFLC